MKALKIFAIVFLVDTLINIGFAYFIGVQPNQNIIMTSALFSVIATLVLNQLGALDKGVVHT